MVWKRPSIRIQFHKSMAASANRFQHHFKLRYIMIYIYIRIYIYIYIYIMLFFSLKWMFITIWSIFLQESEFSLWNGCKIPSDIKTSFQISRWNSFVYIVPFWINEIVPVEKTWFLRNNKQGRLNLFNKNTTCVKKIIF